MSENQENQSEKPKFPTLQFADFLENSPPYHLVIISDLWGMSQGSRYLSKPELSLLCEHDSCQGMRFFEYKDSTGGIYNVDKRNELFLEYQCKNCEETKKSFSLLTFGLYERGEGKGTRLK